MCRIRLVDECSFGNLRDIIVPPYAVSVPRIDIEKEAIFGIPLNKPKVRNNSGEWLAFDTKLDNSGDFSAPIAPVAVSLSITSSTQNPSSLANVYQSNFSSPSQFNSQLNNSSSAFQWNNSGKDMTGGVYCGEKTESSMIPSTVTTLATISTPTIAASPTVTATTPTPMSMSMPSPSPNSNLPQTVTSSTVSSGSTKKKDKYKMPEEEEDSKEIIRIYDGNTSFRKRIYKTIAVPKNSTYQQILVKI
jgi:hypothetical protein